MVGCSAVGCCAGRWGASFLLFFFFFFLRIFFLCCLPYCLHILLAVRPFGRQKKYMPIFLVVTRVLFWRVPLVGFMLYFGKRVTYCTQSNNVFLRLEVQQHVRTGCTQIDMFSEPRVAFGIDQAMAFRSASCVPVIHLDRFVVKDKVGGFR